MSRTNLRCLLLVPFLCSMTYMWKPSVLLELTHVAIYTFSIKWKEVICMAEFAYKDSSRIKKIYPDDALAERKLNPNVQYFCPNPDCNAKLIPKRGSASRNQNSFFCALKTKKHIEDCNYKAYYDEESALEAAKIRNAGLYESDFSIEVLLEKMYSYTSTETKESTPKDSTNTEDLEDDKASKEIILSNTTKLYRYCKFHEITDILGDKELRKIVIDSRTIFDTYKHFIFEGVYLIELPIFKMAFIAETQTLRFRIKKRYIGDLDVDYFFHLRFTSNDLFWEKYKELKEYKNTRSTLVIISKVTKDFGNDKNYYCEIRNTAQMYFVKSEELEHF